MEIRTEQWEELTIHVTVGSRSNVKTGLNQRQYNAFFDLLDISKATCNIGPVEYPDTKTQINFTRNRWNHAYKELTSFCEDYLAGEASPYSTLNEKQVVYNLWVFNCKAQKENTNEQQLVRVFFWNR